MCTRHLFLSAVWFFKILITEGCSPLFKSCGIWRKKNTKHVVYKTKNIYTLLTLTGTCYKIKTHWRKMYIFRFIRMMMILCKQDCCNWLGIPGLLYQFSIDVITFLEQRKRFTLNDAYSVLRYFDICLSFSTCVYYGFSFSWKLTQKLSWTNLVWRAQIPNAAIRCYSLCLLPSLRARVNIRAFHQHEQIEFGRWLHHPSVCFKSTCKHIFSSKW